jgi:nucleotidyltransferase substrate binding protein (TIGR01987 family)
MKDYLQDNGNTILPEITARAVIKEAFASNMINDGQVWIDMMLHRNILSHTYDFQKFQEVLKSVEERYLDAIEKLDEWFLERIV